ncbi:MAG: hypothetical protein COB51_04915 [Moraxellaceae bacterium]|nr:MAG: hypothetical protein COB51_04915 [Moraxellaceae bacterium]
MVKPIAVDVDVVNLNPDLVGHRDADLFRQIVSNSIHDEQISNAAKIVALTNNSSLRSNIIRALGRRHNDEAQLALRNIYDAGVTEKESALILGSIKPKDLEDPATDWILAKLNGNELSEATNRQMMAKLLIVSRHSGLNSPGIPSKLFSKVDIHWHELLQDVYQSSAKRTH